MEHGFEEDVEAVSAGALLGFHFVDVQNPASELLLHLYWRDKDAELLDRREIDSLVCRSAGKRPKILASLHQGTHEVNWIKLFATNPVHEILRRTHFAAHYCDKANG